MLYFVKRYFNGTFFFRVGGGVDTELYNNIIYKCAAQFKPSISSRITHLEVYIKII